MWVRKRLDINWSDLAVGIGGSFLSLKRDLLAGRIERDWSPDGDAMVCLSVRTGFDLLLGALELPPQSEVLISALTIPDMGRIIQQRGLVPVPVDLTAEDLAPDLELMQRAITPATRAVVVAHLSGSRFSLRPIVELARRHDLLLIEDCAQAFDGRQYPGHPDADVSMFSFGPIKTATALGGAVLRVRDRGLLRQMRARQAGYPVQHRRVYLRRLLKYGAFKALCWRPVFGVLIRRFKALGINTDRLINGGVRGFAGPDFLARIRRQPSAPLLAVLRRRLRTYDPRRLARRGSKGRMLAELLYGKVCCPGARLAAHSFWIFPILVENPKEVIAELNHAGFDATQGHSLGVVPRRATPPSDRGDLEPHVARATLAKIVFVPIYPEIPDRSLRRMARVLIRVARSPVRQTADRPVLSTL